MSSSPNKSDTGYRHDIGTPSSFVQRNEKKTNDSIEVLLYGENRSQITTEKEISKDELGKKSSIIDIQNLRRLASKGIPDNGSHRGVVWRILMNYLPCDRSQWKEVLQRQRQTYRDLVEELFQNNEENCDADNAIRNNVESTESNKSLTETRSTDEKLQSNPNEKEELKNNNESPDTKAAQIEITNSTGNSSDLIHIDSENQLICNDLNELKKNTESFEIIDRKISNVSIDENGNMNEVEQSKSKKSFINIPARNPDSEKINSLHGSCSTGELSNISSQISDTKQINKECFDSENKQTENNEQNISGERQSNLDDDLCSPSLPSSSYTSFNKNDESTSEHFHENEALLDEIRKDVVRTHPSFHFFLEPEDNLGQRRYAAIERILFVWAKLNKGVRYVQGMNEIAGTIYFVLANDSNEEWAKEAEADAYFLFNTLMIDMRDVFVPDLDDAATGIQGRIANFVTLLSLHDPEIKCHFDDIGIDATFFCVRWLTTLLSREFTLPDTIRVWDSMFASTHKDNFIRYVCVTMVMVIRGQLLQNDFSQNLRLLQSYPPTNIDRLLESSRALWIYESQVTLACYKGGISLRHALVNLVPPTSIIMAYGLSGGVATKKMSLQSSLPSSRNNRRGRLHNRSLSVDTNAKNSKDASKNRFFGGGARQFFSSMSNLMLPESSPANGQSNKGHDTK